MDTTTQAAQATRAGGTKRTSWQWARVTGSVEFHAMKNAREMECGTSWSRGARLEQPADGGPALIVRCNACCATVGAKARNSTRVPQLTGLCRCHLAQLISAICPVLAKADRAAEVESVTYYTDAKAVRS